MATTWPSITWTASRSNSRRALVALLLVAIAWFAAQPVAGCPFCTALEPTLAQRRAGARATLLAEVEREAAGGAATLKLHQVLDGDNDAFAGQETLKLPLDLAAPAGTLVVLFGDGEARDGLSWHAVAVNEASYAYLARAPRDDLPAAERLAYFARYLEHPDKLVAEDAYLEFGHAPLDVVASCAAALPMEQARRWLTDPAVPGHRKGFYGLLLGLAPEPDARRKNAELLRQLILSPEDDFRAGFDGVLGGYLLLNGDDALALIESRYLSNPTAAVGDVRHAQTALRFYHEYGREVPAERLCAAAAHLLDRPEFAAATIVDLARWQDWSPLDRIAGLYFQPGYEEPAIRRAIVGYLAACPTGEAQAALADLRAVDPTGVAEAEQLLLRTGSVPQAQ